MIRRRRPVRPLPGWVELLIVVAVLAAIMVRW